MPAALTHGIVAIAAGRTAFRRTMPRRFWPLAILCSAAPDIDVGLMHYGVAYDDLWGHRGMTHSLVFAVALGFVVTTWLFRDWATFGRRRWWTLLVFFTLITASHGFLDAFTNGGLGIAFFAPFDTTRSFMPWTPIEVSPIGLGGFIRCGGLQTLVSEMLWIWLPVVGGCAIIAVAQRLVRARSSTAAA